MKNSMKTMMLTAAISGLMGGSAASLQATQTTPTPEGTAKVSVRTPNTGKVSYNKVSYDDKDKHSCKGKNDCKGQGGCKSSDNGCKGKNSCKGKGGCATDGSKPPELAAQSIPIGLARFWVSPYLKHKEGRVYLCPQIGLTVLPTTE